MRFRELDTSKRRRDRAPLQASEVVADGSIQFVEMTDGQLVALRTHLGAAARATFAGVTAELRAPGLKPRELPVSAALAIAGNHPHATVALPAAAVRDAFNDIQDVDAKLGAGPKPPSDRTDPGGLGR